METPVVRLLIRSGLVPENMLEQLRRWKLLSPETEQFIRTGNPVSTLSREWEDAEGFVQFLERLIHEENRTIREADFAVAGDFRKVWLFGKNQNGDAVADKVDVVVDKLGRVFLPIGTMDGAKIEAVAFGFLEDFFLASKNMRPVARTETRYADEKETAHVLYLEWDSAGPIPYPTRITSGDPTNGHTAAP